MSGFALIKKAPSHGKKKKKKKKPSSLFVKMRPSKWFTDFLKKNGSRYI